MVKSPGQLRRWRIVAVLGAAAMTGLALVAWFSHRTPSAGVTTWVSRDEGELLETEMIADFPDAIVRDGNTLLIIGDNGRVAVFENNPCDRCDGRQFFQAVGYIDELALFVVVEHGWEWTNAYIVHKPTGGDLRVPMYVRLSPSGRQFSAVNFGEGQFGMVGVMVGHVDASGIVVEFYSDNGCYHRADWISDDLIQLGILTDELSLIAKSLEECALTEAIDGDVAAIEPSVWLIFQDGAWALRNNQSLDLD